VAIGAEGLRYLSVVTRRPGGHVPTRQSAGSTDAEETIVPTGVHIRDVRTQLFDAAERILLRDGANAVTSRAVTAEAGCAKGVLHRHFADFDGFLAELVGDRVARVTAIRIPAGTGPVVDTVTAALTEVFEPAAVGLVALVISRDTLRARLRSATPVGIPLLNEAAAVLTAYLSDEREMGRIAADADVDTLALTLIGATHLRYTGGGTVPLDRVVATVLADVVQRRLL
jgi:AcrR family transcriptional regulator